MKPSKWDTYFLSNYKPIAGSWSKEDVKKYEQWYFSWLKYIDEKCKVLQKKANIFEIGSGVGSMTSLLFKRGHDVTGSDISGFMVKVANELCKPSRFIYCDIQKGIPLKKKFDVIMGFEVLEHVPNLQKALKNIHISLKNQGYFIGTSPYPYAKNYLDKTHVHVLYPQQWRKLFIENGFSSVELYPMSFLPLLWRLDRMLNPVLPFNISWPMFVSTVLIVSKK